MSSDVKTVFPASERVEYKTNPLVEVICQLRFPTILRIDSEVPAEFQEHIRGEYPHFQEVEQTELPANVPEPFAGLLRQATDRLRTYHFKSDNDTWMVGLANNFLSISTKEYRSWGEFRRKLEFVQQQFIRIYKPAYFSRVGLRYRNAIRPTSAKEDNPAWDTLLRPHILGSLSSEVVNQRVNEVANTTLIELFNNAKVRLRHGISTEDDGNGSAYVIDADFFTDDRTELSDVNKRLDYFNQESGRLFRWCITEFAHDDFSDSKRR